jgi:hypothetical protein
VYISLFACENSHYVCTGTTQQPEITRSRLRRFVPTAPRGGRALALDGTLALRCVPHRLVHSLTTHTSSRAPSYAAGGVRHFTRKTRAGPNGRSGGRSRRSELGMRAPDTTAGTCGVYSPGRSRWRGVSAWAELRDDVSPRWRKRPVLLSVNPGTVCHLRAPIVRGSRWASYGQILIWFGLNPKMRFRATVNISFGPSPRCAPRRREIRMYLRKRKYSQNFSMLDYSPVSVTLIDQ